MSECRMSLPWEVGRTIHGNSKYVVTKMCTMSLNCSRTSISMALICHEVRLPLDLILQEKGSTRLQS
jgi:hypothetical protein